MNNGVISAFDLYHNFLEQHVAKFIKFTNVPHPPSGHCDDLKPRIVSSFCSISIGVLVT